MYTVYHRLGAGFMRTTDFEWYEDAREFARRWIHPLPHEGVRHGVATVLTADGQPRFDARHDYGQRKPVVSEIEWP